MSNERPAELEALLKDDPDYVYSEEELDAIEELDPDLAFRIDRAQTLAAREAEAAAELTADEGGPVDAGAVAEAIEEARGILMRDGGDIELVAVEGSKVKVRMKGACVGCPMSVLDLNNVVRRIVKRRVPGVTAVANTF